MSLSCLNTEVIYDMLAWPAETGPVVRWGAPSRGDAVFEILVIEEESGP